MTDYKDQVAAFLANGGQITKVEAGAQALTKDQMKAALGWEPNTVRKPTPVIHEVIGSNGKSYYHNAEGEWL